MQIFPAHGKLEKNYVPVKQLGAIFYFIKYDVNVMQRTYY